MIDDVAQLEHDRFLLRFGGPPYPRLHVAIHPRFSTVHLARGIKAPSAPTELAAAMTHALKGRAVVRLVKPSAERLVRIDFDSGSAVVIELMGKASNLLLLDADGRIARFARSHAGSFRRPVEGQPYEPPRPPPTWVEADLQAVDEETFARLAEGAREPETLAQRLRDRLPGFSAQLAREVGWRAARGEPPWRAFVDLRSRAARGDRAPVLYSPGPPSELPASLPLTSRNLFAFPFPLECAAGLDASPMPTVNAAEEAAAACLLRHMSWLSLHQSLTGVLDHERRRIVDLVRVLQAELSQAEAFSERDRRNAELILAGLGDARKEGGRVRVIDHYDPEGGTIDIAIDPRLDLKQNAQRYFKSARRAGRTRELAPQRLEALGRRLADVDAARGRAAAATSRAELEHLERELQDAGLVRAFRRSERAEVGRKPAYVQVREFRTREGFTVLVGRTGAENDHLTFKVAAPHDLWLHAAGRPGAHVIVRNPRRIDPLPEATVLEAAAIAAWFSKGKAEKDLDVHVAWRRHVRKGRGMSPGMVMLKKHQTVRVSPALPAGRRDV